MSPEEFAAGFLQEFNYRKNKTFPSSPVECSFLLEKGLITFQFRWDSFAFDLLIPAPFENQDGNWMVGDATRRCVADWLMDNSVYDYLGFVFLVLTRQVELFFDNVTSYAPQVVKLITLHEKKNPSLIVRRIQLLIDEIVNRLPLEEAPMKDFMMNRRVQIMDVHFEGLRPQDKLAYQTAKQRVFFPWSSIGLADGSAATDNYILKDTIRRFTPFGEYDNPMRNLYSTLGMKGPELPLIQTKSEAECRAKRGGMNLVTVFLDHPDTFEDQLILSERFLEAFSKETRRMATFGDVLVQAGDKLVEGDVVARELNGESLTLKIDCEYAVVEEIRPGKVSFNSRAVPHTLIKLTVYRKFKHGFKLTNRHGNKGVVTFADTGFVHDPVRGKVPVDIIVSARSVAKRKNFGQILEALSNNLAENAPKVIADDFQGDMGELRSRLVAKGYAQDLTVPVETQWGNFRAISGCVFWGLVKTVEDQIWTSEDLEEVKSNGMRRAGLKIGPVEFRSLSTVFGVAREPVFAEIMEHTSGRLQAMGHLYTIMSSLGSYEEGLPKIRAEHIRPVDQQNDFFQGRLAFDGTIADVKRLPRAFLLELPFGFCTAVDEKGASHFYPEGDRPPVEVTPVEQYVTRYLYVPGPDDRELWMHPSGLYGMNELTTLFNNLIDYVHRPREERGWKRGVFASVVSLVTTLTRRLSSKRGAITQNILSVRYPFSAKAVATQRSTLPRNTVGIHTSMAKQLGVKDGDFVIAERFPCLGFTSMRIQRVSIHDDPNRRCVIEVSGNSLVSQGLDFDGDVIYLMAFKSEAARTTLQANFYFPGKRMNDILQSMSDRLIPAYGELGFDDYGVMSFPPASAEYNAQIMEKLAGVKLYTGPVIALCYNVLRIVEPYVEASDPLNVAIELLLDKVANSVFSQKHGRDSLQEKAIEAICLASPEKLMELFSHEKGRERYESLTLSRGEAERICEIILMEAQACGVSDLRWYHENVYQKFNVPVTSRIVKQRRRVYFATRAFLSEPHLYLKCLLDRHHPDDIVSELFKRRIGDRIQWSSEPPPRSLEA